MEACPARPRTRSPVATRCRTRSGSTPPTVHRGRSTPSSPTSRCRADSSARSTPRAAPHVAPRRRARPTLPRSAADAVSPAFARRLLAEFLGTAFLLVAVIGSGIAAQRLSPHDAGIELLENAVATGAALVAIILAFAPVSGAHLNPLVTLVDRMFGGVTNRDAVGYVGAQVCGAALGAVVANLMFALPAAEWSSKTRSGGGVWLAEVVATLGLLLVVFGIVRSGRGAIAPFAVGAYITGAYFFTSSTS